MKTNLFINIELSITEKIKLFLIFFTIGEAWINHVNKIKLLFLMTV